MSSEVANSVDCILMSKPASLTIACTIWAIFCASDVALGDGNVLGVVAIGGRDPLIADVGLAIHCDLRDTVAIERKLESFAHPGVLAERIFLREIAFADIDSDALVADFGDPRDLEA